MAPKGFDAIILVAEYGARFTSEDEKALNLLNDFLGKESNECIILLLTHGDQAVYHAKDKKTSPEEVVKEWIGTLPEWVQTFIKEIKHRVVLFDNMLREDENPEAFKKQLSNLIEVNNNLQCEKLYYKLVSEDIPEPQITSQS